MSRDYYEVLGVARDASGLEVKKAFRGLARELHPDVNAHDPEAEEKFKEAAEAYEVLSDPDRRHTYDTFGHAGLRSGGWAPQAADFGSVEQLFRMFFGQGLGFGFETVRTSVGACDRCEGSGGEPGTPVRSCIRCDGAGQLRHVARTMFGHVVQITTCERCGGTGRIPETPCERCGGSGLLRYTAHR